MTLRRVPSKRRSKTCPHGRTEGYCTICKEETDEGLNAEKPSQSGKKKEIKTCPHGRTEDIHNLQRRSRII